MNRTDDLQQKSNEARYLCDCCSDDPAGVDARDKGPLLQLETAGSVWPPPGGEGVSALGDDTTGLEAPLLAPSAPPLHLGDASDDSFLDDVSIKVG